VAFGATLEAFYQYNWNRPPDRVLLLRAYDTRANTFGIQQAIEQLLQESTLAAEYRLADGFLVRVEFRRDWSDERFFPGRLGSTDLRHAQNTALIGGVWWFGNKQGTWVGGVTCCSHSAWYCLASPRSWR